MKCAVLSIINVIGGWHVLHQILAPHLNKPVKHLRGFKVPQWQGEVWLHISRDTLRKDICGGTVPVEERSPVHSRVTFSTISLTGRLARLKSTC